MSRLLILALVLACPLMMLWMMRGHNRGGHDGDGSSDALDTSAEARSTEELRRERNELERLIEQREAEDARSIRNGAGDVPVRSERARHHG